MKTSKWILGTIYALCFSVLVGVLGTCDLQKDDSPDSIEAYYKLEATGSGAEISIVAGFFTSYTLDGLEPIGSWGSNSYSGESLWEKEILDEEVGSLKTGHEYIGLFVEAINKAGDVGPLTTKIAYVDKNFTEWPPADGSIISNISIVYAPFWTPSDPLPDFPHPLPPYSSVICTELYRQGLMDENIFEADQAFGSHLRADHNDVLVGYHLWAKPVVKWMQKSERVTKVVAFIAKPWSYEMAYRMGARDKGTFVGKILMDVGVPVCRTIGRAMIWAGNISPHDDADGHEDSCPREFTIPTE